MSEIQDQPTDTRITVVMPVRAYCSDYLTKALRSVICQTSERWRLLVVDDGADSKLQRLLAPALSDDRVGVLDNQGRGFAAALNTGLRQASTDFVSILFADDVVTSGAIEVFTAYLERFPEVDLVHAARATIDEQDRMISRVRPASPSFAISDFRTSSPVKHPMCFRRQLALAIGGMDESLDPIGVDDWDFPWSMVEAGARVMAVSECLYLWRDHRDSFRLTTHVPRSVHVRAHRRIMRKHGVGRLQTEFVVASAKRNYLRQCLYRSSIDRWLKERLGHDARRGWRESQL